MRPLPSALSAAEMDPRPATTTMSGEDGQGGQSQEIRRGVEGQAGGRPGCEPAGMVNFPLESPSPGCREVRSLR